MAEVTAKDIMALRAKTSAGIALCKEALVASDGDMEKAVKYINERSDVVSRLNQVTGAKIGLCRMAIQDAEQDYEKALKIINDRGWAQDSVEVEDDRGEGIIGTYVHSTDHKTVALVEVSCITDFVSRGVIFRELAAEMAKQVAAMKPTFVSRDTVPQEKLDELKDLFEREVKEEGKPEHIIPTIIEGKFNKFYAENCLLEQKWFKDESKTMKEVLDEAIGSTGEPIKIERILTWEFGKRS